MSVLGVFRTKRFHFWFGMLVSILLLVWLFGRVEWSQVWSELKGVHIRVFIPITVVLLVHFILRAIRWRDLLPGDEEVSIRKRFDALMIGNFATFILPLRAGEFVRPLMLKRWSTYRFASAFASVVVERFFDLTSVLLSFAILVIFVDGFPDWALKGAGVLGTVSVAILAFMIVSAFFPGAVNSLIKFCLNPLPESLSSKVENFAHDIIEGSRVLHDFGRLFRIVFLSILVWLSNYLLFYLFLALFDFPISFDLAVCTAVLVALAVAAPSAPGFLGVYQAGCVAAFKLFHLPESSGLAFGLITHLYTYIVFIAYGIYLIMRENLKLSELQER